MNLVIQAPDIETRQLKELAELCGATEIVALRSAQTQAFRLTPAAPHPEIPAYCENAALDFGFVPAEQALDRVGAVAMDMDSTLITIECIDEIADMRGIKPQVSAITESAMRGEIDFAESLRRRVGLLQGLDVGALERVYEERLRLSPGAERMLTAFKRVGATTLLVSGGFTFFTAKLQARLDLDRAVSNTLEAQDGKLTGRLVGSIVDAEVKAAQVRELKATLPPEKLVVVLGDGANDLPMLAEADVSVAYRAKPVVRAQARYAINVCGLDAVVNLFHPAPTRSSPGIE